jgi:metal transporter CNNM
MNYHCLQVNNKIFLIPLVLTFYGREIVRVFPDAKLEEILKIFKTGKSHLAIVQDVKYPENSGL